jgi:hypothetical protein
MLDPSPELEAYIREMATIAAAEPNSAKTFDKVLNHLVRIPGMDQARAMTITGKVLPGSLKAFREREAGKQARLMAAVRAGGRLN